MHPCHEMWWLGISSIAAVGSCSRIAPHVLRDQVQAKVPLDAVHRGWGALT